jgi:pilus assembly protein CpaB
MKSARVLVHAIALTTGGAAAFLVGSHDEKKPASAPAPIAQLPAVDALSGTGMSAPTSSPDPRWQTWPAPATDDGSGARKININAVRFGAGSNR